jgi:hypothetical protein
MSVAIGAGDPHAFSVGRAIARTFSTWWSHVVVFAVLNLAASAPILVLAVLSDTPVKGITAPAVGGPGGVTDAQLPAGFWGAYAVASLLSLVEIGAITQGAISHLAGRRVSLGAMVATGLRRALPLLAVGLLCYVLLVLGTVLLVVPGVFLGCALAVALPAVVVERPGVLGALRRSFALTKGKRLAVLATVLVLMVVGIGVNLSASFALPALTGAFSAPMVGTVLGFAVNAVFGSFLWVAPAVVYHDLRVSKEGVATAELAAVFE